MKTTMTPLVSVLMTVYNREKYIAAAIESIIASTYQHWELIIVDDQSKDTSVEIANSYAQKDPRIKVYVNEINLGDYPNRNKAATYAQGMYLKYLDADDLIYPYGLEQLVYYMEQFPEAGYGLCSLDQDKIKQFPFILSSVEAYERHYLNKTPLFHKAPLSSIIKKSVFDTVGGFSGKQHLGDFEMWHLLSQKYPVVLMPHGIVWYREHEEQQMNDNRTDPFVPFKYLLLAEQILNSHNTPLRINQIEKVINELKSNQAKAILSAIKNHSLKKGIQLFNGSGLSVTDLLKYFIKK